MTKKFLFGLMFLSIILFFSCGSTKQDLPDLEDLQAAVEEEVGEGLEKGLETGIAAGLEEGLEAGLASETGNDQDLANGSEESESVLYNLEELYPPLEEITEPELIDLEPVDDNEESTLIAQTQEEEETEPLEAQEELPPLPEAPEGAMDAEPVEGQEATVVPEPVEGSQNTEDQEVEPTIEIQTEEEVQEEVILPSRSVSLKKGETLVITYPGSGWIYMGSTSEYNNLASRGRKLGSTDTKYTLLAKEAGTQIHHFYKIDNLTGQYIDDYIEVTVLEKKGNSSTVVTAPSYAEVVPKKPQTPAKATPKPAPAQEASPAPQETSASKTSVPQAVTAPQAGASSVAAPKEEEASEENVIVIGEEESPEEELDLEPIRAKARKALSAKNYDDAYPALVQYLELSTDNRDEALYLLGQILESNSKYKDIKQAVETYQTLCDSYPASKYWENANKRIVYLKRFYINIH